MERRTTGKQDIPENTRRVCTDDTGSCFTSAVMPDHTAKADYGCVLPPTENYLQVNLPLSLDGKDRETLYFVCGVD